MGEPTVHETEALIIKLFWGITDMTGEPICTHMHRVAKYAVALGVKNINAALLHDVIEDIPGYDADKLRGLGYRERTVRIVQNLTKKPDETYQTYIKRLLEYNDLETLLIKLADHMDNTCPDRWSRLPTPKIDQFLARYAGVRMQLTERINEINGWFNEEVDEHG